MAAIDRPIFIVGCPRSGTGILYQTLRLHPSVAWVTPFSNWICGKQWFRQVPPRLAWMAELVINRIPNALLPTFLQGPYDGSLGLSSLHETHEGQSIWTRVFSNPPNHLATEREATPEVQSYLHAVVRWHLHYHDCPRFLSKTPRNALRLRFLHALFPNARIIHLIRDGRAVARSILKRRQTDHGRLDEWWGVRPPGWDSMLTDPPLKQAAWTWKQCLQQVRADSSVFRDDQFFELHYESFATDPEHHLRRLFSFVDLDPEAFFQSEHRHQIKEIHRPQQTWETKLDTNQKAFLNETLGEDLRRYGYENT